MRAAGLAGFWFGSAGMFAAQYSTQAILPELSRDFGISPSRAGLSVSAVIAAVAVGVWIWGPLSDRIGRRRSLLLASAALVLPTVVLGLAPNFEALLALRALQGLCMPGLLTVGVPYVMEAFGPWLGGRAMGVYVSSLVAGGLIGRIGVALLASGLGWRWAVSLMAVFPATACVVMWRWLPPVGAPARTRGALGGQLRNAQLLRVTVAGGCMFFMFIGVFSYVTFRLEGAPFGFDPTEASLIFLLWLFGVSGPFVGRLTDHIGWRATAVCAVGLASAALLLSLPAWLPTLAVALGMLTVSMFSAATSLQLGVASSTAVDRGVASAIYFCVYYTSGGLGAYLPGLAWQQWGWNGVTAVGLAATAIAIAALVSSRDTASYLRRGSRLARTATDGTG
jgi:MFS transporter, YNFM family, putative membrane transport protein